MKRLFLLATLLVCTTGWARELPLTPQQEETIRWMARHLAETQGLSTNDNWHRYHRVRCRVPDYHCRLNEEGPYYSDEELGRHLPVWTGGDEPGVWCPMDFPLCFVNDTTHTVGLNPYYTNAHRFKP